MFANERKLFPEVDHHTTFSLNVYGGPQEVSFDSISNLYDPNTIDQCFINDGSDSPIPGIKDNLGNWNTIGHPSRRIHISSDELKIFLKVFDGDGNWQHAKLPVLHVKELVDVLRVFSHQHKYLSDYQNLISSAVMWDESLSQKDGTITRNVHFPESPSDTIYSGPHLGVANPLFKTSRRVCKLNSDYDNIDLNSISETYIQRCNYSINCTTAEYIKRVPKNSNGVLYNSDYRICVRKMLNQGGERTLVGALIPPQSAHINGLFGINIGTDTVLFAAACFSLPYDFYVKVTGKANINLSLSFGLPVLSEFRFINEIVCRALMLNCVNRYYSDIWTKEYSEDFTNVKWAKKDNRLNDIVFSKLTEKWVPSLFLHTDYARREALVELDVLVALALGMTIKQLITIYRIQFSVLQSYESDTWYDSNGRIVFTNNRSLIGVGLSRSEWENVKNMKDGIVTQVIIDDTIPDGPIERTIEYVAPFDRCDREKDYEEVWATFEKRFKNK